MEYVHKKLNDKSISIPHDKLTMLQRYIKDDFKLMSSNDFITIQELILNINESDRISLMNILGQCLFYKNRTDLIPYINYKLISYYDIICFSLNNINDLNPKTFVNVSEKQVNFLGGKLYLKHPITLQAFIQSIPEINYDEIKNPDSWISSDSISWNLYEFIINLCYHLNLYKDSNLTFKIQIVNSISSLSQIAITYSKYKPYIGDLLTIFLYSSLSVIYTESNIGKNNQQIFDRLNKLFNENKEIVANEVINKQYEKLLNEASIFKAINNIIQNYYSKIKASSLGNKALKKLKKF